MGLILTAMQNAGEIDNFQFEGIKLKIGEDRCTYSPDFVYWKGVKTFIREVKGPFIREDSLIKFKCAKRQFPNFTFDLWQLTKDGWTQLL